jgi:hypothetical protein
MLLGILLPGAVLVVYTGLYGVVMGSVVNDGDPAVGLRIFSALISAGGLFVGRFSLVALSAIGKPLQFMQADLPKKLYMNNAIKGTLLLAVLMTAAVVFVATVGEAYAEQWYAWPQGIASFCVWFAATQGLKGLSLFIGPLELAELQRKAEISMLDRVKKLTEFKNQVERKRLDVASKNIGARPIFTEGKKEVSTIGIVAVGLGLASLVMPYFAAVLFVPATFICGVIAFRQGDMKLGGIALVMAVIGMFHIVNVSNQIGEVQKDLHRSLRSLR